ncbi:MAG: hypothetical protein AAGE89_13280, partial [Pseudomonadota bacterium]
MQIFSFEDELEDGFAVHSALAPPFDTNAPNVTAFDPLQDVAPETQLEATALAEEQGVALSSVLKNMPLFRRQKEIEDEIAQRKEAPLLDTWMTTSPDEDLTSDDITSLAGLEQISRAFQQADAAAIVRSQTFFRDLSAYVETSWFGRFHHGFT